MGQPRIVHGATQWYLIARKGDMVLRVRAGMPLGETETGELSFDPSCAQLELGIADDGGLTLNALNDHELRSAGGGRFHQEVLARDRRAEIRLPNNVLRLVTDFVDPAQPDEIVEVRSEGRAGFGLTPDDVPPPVADFFKPEFKPEQPKYPEQPERFDHSEQRERSEQPERSEYPAQSELSEYSAQPEETSKVRHRRPRPSPVMASLIGLCGVGLVLLYLAFREDGAQLPPETVVITPAPRIAPVEVPSSVAADPAPTTDVAPSVASAPTLLPDRDEPPSTEPAIREQVMESPAEAPPAAVTKPVAKPVTKPIAKPTVQRREDRTSSPAVDKTVSADVAAPAPKASPRAATVATKPPASRDTDTADKQDVELARRRALFAADQALAQGRLMTPSESSAYTLYNRVLALDPGSPQANNGLQSVRQGLINRALAQLAANALDDARRSLREATDAGADTSLVTHLRDEVDFRQQQIDARVARDE